jgi:hypothetical protein
MWGSTRISRFHPAVRAAEASEAMAGEKGGQGRSRGRVVVNMEMDMAEGMHAWPAVSKAVSWYSSMGGFPGAPLARQRDYYDILLPPSASTSTNLDHVCTLEAPAQCRHLSLSAAACCPCPSLSPSPRLPPPSIAVRFLCSSVTAPSPFPVSHVCTPWQYSS